MTANCCADSDKSVAKAQGEVKEEARLPDCTGRFFRFVMSGRLPLLRMLHIRHVQDGAEDSLVETEQDHQPEGSEGKDPCCFTLSGMARACPRLEGLSMDMCDLTKATLLHLERSLNQNSMPRKASMGIPGLLRFVMIAKCYQPDKELFRHGFGKANDRVRVPQLKEVIGADLLMGTMTSSNGIHACSRGVWGLGDDERLRIFPKALMQ
eukprot:CAMPEP_0114279044 /NCGR_PEP_ID=MMETSP0059-20121206/1662_1 /TAXON_ID=36894 /ORGANISM="Pyramimonas parkeae, Strain CCMP726" /LENGTH=208 /DNA_ID=CAMNT_0001399287 /DNA_START=496 /DNA_END=1122 /DNA_ORIENTATION=+